MVIRNAAGLAQFNEARMGKTTLAVGSRLFAGLNAFEPRQKHDAHTHPDQDKLYFVLEGKAEVTIGAQTDQIGAGDLAMAPAGIEHSIINVGAARLVVMVVFAPPPVAKG